MLDVAMAVSLPALGSGGFLEDPEKVIGIPLIVIGALGLAFLLLLLFSPADD